MEQLPKLFCPHCGVQVIADAAFCHACGRAVAGMKPSNAAQPQATETGEQKSTEPEIESRPPTFRGLRTVNWIIVAILVPGAALMLARSAQPAGALFVVSLMAFLVGTFLTTAVSLSPDTFYFAGIPVGAYRSTLRKVSFVCNVVMLLFGLAGVVACVATKQFGPLLGMLVYAVPPALNIKALRSLARHYR